MMSTPESRFGAFSGIVACILVLALTAMAFVALESPRHGGVAWEISPPEASAEPGSS